MPLLARTVVLNIGLNAGKQLFANQTGRRHEVIKTLCVIKAMTGWNAEKVGRICRERCGGGSFLAYNMIGSGVMGAHSGITAEGDNSVLMQKVTKDLLAHTQNGKHKMPKILKQTLKEISQKEDVSPSNCLKNLINIREQYELKNFTKKLQDLILDK